MKDYFSIREEQREAEGDEIAGVVEEYLEYLEEKSLIVGGGRSHGQAVILAGGAGSGKSYVARNYMDGTKFKVVNPDDLKDLVLGIRDRQARTGKDLSDIVRSSQIKSLVAAHRNSDMRRPMDAKRLHDDLLKMRMNPKNMISVFKEPIRRLDAQARDLGGVFRSAPLDDVKKVITDPSLPSGKQVEERLPNVMFDFSLRNMEQLTSKDPKDPGILMLLRQAGYRPENIHVVWILTDYRIAMRQNLTRERVMVSSMLIRAHQGVAQTMDQVVRNYVGLGINGDIAVVAGGRDQSVEYEAGRHYDVKGREFTLPSAVISHPITADFRYFRIKKAGATALDMDQVAKFHDYLLTAVPPPGTDHSEVQSGQIKRIMLDYRNADRVIERMLSQGAPVWRIHAHVRKNYPFTFAKPIDGVTAGVLRLRETEHRPLISQVTALILGMKEETYRRRSGAESDRFIPAVQKALEDQIKRIPFSKGMKSIEDVARRLRT